jgi:hypothetical protein
MTWPAGSRVVLGLAALIVCTSLGASALASGQATGVAEPANVKAKVGLPAAGADVPKLTLTMPPTGPGSAFLVLENNSDRKIERLSILNFLVPEDGVSGSAAKVTIESAGAKPGQDGWVIEPHKDLPMILTVASLDSSTAPGGLLVGTVATPALPSSRG